MTAGAGGRDLNAYVTGGNTISVRVIIGRHRDSDAPKRETAATASPYTVAGFLRDLADDVEHAGEDRS